MTISYNWLHEYLPEKIEPEKLSSILTSIGLEVESMEIFESMKGGLKGLVAGAVIQCEKHPDADKLKLTKVNIGNDIILDIVCGAPNVAIGQKVIVAPVGTTIYPTKGEPMTMKKAKIRGAESQGMICAEDEIGLGESHDGIKILPSETIPGTAIADLFQMYSDYVYEIGLTPNRMDAMSHWGVARDVCAYLTYHHKKSYRVNLPNFELSINPEAKTPISISIENKEACKRYCGISIENVQVAESPDWLQNKIKSIGLKPINNIVDITNFVLHETGQPLHAFDQEKIRGNKIIVKNVDAGTSFTTLDDKKRKLEASDLMICDSEGPICMAGVYGGKESGVIDSTRHIFLESACFHKTSIRRTSIHHDLRTDAATRFEKGVDSSNTKNVLMRAAKMIIEIAGGTIQGGVIDQFPAPSPKVKVHFELEYLERLSGKKYRQEDVESILSALGFEITQSGNHALDLAVPFSKNDIHLPADIVEEIMRIDGLDNIEIPETICIAPSAEKNAFKKSWREKIANTFTGWGFQEIFTNSITNSAFYDESVLKQSVKMMNSLTNELNMMRPDMLQSGLQVIQHNLNRRNNHLKLYEFGKTYSVTEDGRYEESNHLAIYLTGSNDRQHWHQKNEAFDFYWIKGVSESVLQITGQEKISYESLEDARFSKALSIHIKNKKVGIIGEIASGFLKHADIKSAVFYADIHWDALLEIKTKPIKYKELSRFPSVHRDLALIVDKNVSYSQLEQIALSCKIVALQKIDLFDVFESEKLGPNKKSMALSFIFTDETKTMTDSEIDQHMSKLIQSFEKNAGAEIRK